MEYSLATLMLNIVNDEKLNMEKTIGWQGTCLLNGNYYDSKATYEKLFDWTR